MGVGTTARLVRSDRSRQIHGSMEVTEYEPVSSFTEVSRFGPFTLHAQATLAPVAPASTRLELVIDTHARGVIRLLLPLMEGNLPQDDGQEPSHQGAGGSDRAAYDLIHLEPSGTSCMPYTDLRPHHS